jgi:hypothetical protein
MKKNLLACLLALAPFAAHAFPSTLHYQGRLLDDTNLVNDAVSVVFRLYDAASGGTMLYEDSNDVTVVDGFYSAEIGDAAGDLPAALAADEVYLSVEIDGTVLSPRERLGAAGYALVAASVTNGAISAAQLADGAVGSDQLAAEAVGTAALQDGAVTVDKLGASSVASANIVDGTIGADDVDSAAFWLAGGNDGDMTGSFLGTTTDDFMEMRVKNFPFMRVDMLMDFHGPRIAMGGSNVVEFAPGATIGGGFENVLGYQCYYGTIGGGRGNELQRDAQNSTLSGGMDNRIGTNAAFAVLAGGYGNVVAFGADGAAIGGGQFNTAGGTHSTIGGGHGNRILASSATISGGMTNEVGAEFGSIGGGIFNDVQVEGGTIAGGKGNSVVQGSYGSIGGGMSNVVDSSASIGGGVYNYAGGGAVVGGGIQNRAAGIYSTVPGGWYNVASGAYSFAAGFRAKATNAGSFVWADNRSSDFASRRDAEFRVRASNGLVVVGSDLYSRLVVAPATTSDGGTSQILMTEDENETFGMSITYDGTTNQLSIYGKNNSIEHGPHLAILRDSGWVGVGRRPTTYDFEVEGNASKTTAGSWLANSDASIKTEVRTITNALETIDALRPVRFRYTEEHRAKHPSIEDRDYCNYVAQEFREVFPESVETDGEGLLTIDTYNAQPYLVRAVQELHGMVEELRAENEALRARLEALEGGSR